MCPGVNTFLAREIWTAVNGIMRSRGAAPESFGVGGSGGIRVGRCHRDRTAQGPSMDVKKGWILISGWVVGLDSVLEVISSLSGSGIPGSPSNIKDRRKQPQVAPGEV